MSRFRDEIAQEPDLAARLIESSEDAVQAIAKAFKSRKVRGFVIAARGSSDHAADYARYLFGRRQHALVSLAAPSMFTHYASPPSLEGQCVIGISQSGASPDVIAVIEEAKRQGAMSVAITNAEQSPLAAAAEFVLPMLAGPELSVPASKTYLTSLVVLALLSAAITPDRDFEQGLAMLPVKLRDAFSAEPEVARIAHVVTGPRAIVLARGFNLCTAEEIALKLTETSYVLARAWSIADFVHGPVAVVEAGFPVLLVGAGGSVAADVDAIAARLSEYGCTCVGLFDAASAPLDEKSSVRIDSGLPEELTPMTLILLGQLLANQVALARGVDPDAPRALHKVTRTW
ncbi:MAG TPA: SIS domain-containing protein [Candidatus Dormibacteraeota bacterium]|nr:SIS domain-containing protein [Candidatus Dormibacteraeota bacterium]